MKIYNITEIDRESILEMHSKMKKTLISEQVDTDLRNKLNKLLTDGCVKNGKIISLQTTNPALKLAIKQESTKTPGKFRYFFADGRAGIFDANGKFQFLPGKLDCTEVQQAASQQAAQQTAADIESKIATEIKKGWKKLEDLRKEGVDLTTLDRVYDTQVIGSVTLYRPKGSSTTFTPNTSTTQFNQDQLDFIDRFTTRGYKLNPTRVEQSTLVKVTDKELGAPGDLFPNGLVMWYDPNLQSTMSGKDDTILGDIITNQSVDKNVCRKNIEDWYEGFKRRNSIVVEPSTMTKAKKIVQACHDEHYGEWGIAGRGKKFDNILDILTGRVQGGPGQNSPWRIKSSGR
jgi:hypothetical protein